MGNSSGGRSFIEEIRSEDLASVAAVGREEIFDVSRPLELPIELRDVEFLLLAGCKRFVHFIDIRDHEIVGTLLFAPPTDQIHSIVFLPPVSYRDPIPRLAISSYDDVCRVYDVMHLENGQHLVEMKTPDDPVCPPSLSLFNCIRRMPLPAYLSDEVDSSSHYCLIATDASNSVKVFEDGDVEGGKVVSTIGHHQDLAWALDYEETLWPHLLVTAGKDMTIAIWDVSKPRSSQSDASRCNLHAASADSIYCVSFVREAGQSLPSTILGGLGNSTILSLDARTSQIRRFFQTAQEDAVYSLASWDDSGTSFLAGDWAGTVFLYDRRDTENGPCRSFHSLEPSEIAYMERRTGEFTFAVAGSSVRLYDIRKEEPYANLFGEYQGQNMCYGAVASCAREIPSVLAHVPDEVTEEDARLELILFTYGVVGRVILVEKETVFVGGEERAISRATGDIVAIKIIDKSNLEVNRDSLQNEVGILKAVVDPNIVRLYEVYESPDHVYLVMEMLTGGELFDRIVNVYPDGYSEKQASIIMARITRSMMKLHQMDIVHRDLKPENLIYASEDDDSDIKITDFGLAKLSNGDYLLKTACGTPNYVAPEVLLNQGYDASVDMWSLGVILYILLCGFPPFYSENTPELFDQIIAGQYDFPSPYWDNTSKQAKDLVRKLLQVQPHLRYTPQQVLKHPWITGYSTSTQAQAGVVDELRKFNARRKLVVTVEAIIAAKAFVRRLREMSS